MGRANEGSRADIDGSVSVTPRLWAWKFSRASRMSIGLGMTRDEWQDLRSQVDDSFWVMRVIGTL